MTTNTEELAKAVERLNSNLEFAKERNVSVIVEAESLERVLTALTSLQARAELAERRLEKLRLFFIGDANHNVFYLHRQSDLGPLMGPTFGQAIDCLPTPNKGVKDEG